MSDYFTKQEIQEVRVALRNISGVGINIESYDSLIRSISPDEQQKTFFDKAKLWQVIKEIISVLYIERLAGKEMFLHDREDNEYWVIPKTKPKKKD